MANDIKVSSSRIKKRAKELLFLVMETFTKEAGTQIKDMALVLWKRQIKPSIEVIGLITR